jgi:hypothetical protein
LKLGRGKEEYYPNGKIHGRTTATLQNITSEVFQPAFNNWIGN